MAQHEFIYRHHITFRFHRGLTMKFHLSIGKKLSVTVCVPRGQGLTGTVAVEINLLNVTDTLFEMNLIADIVKKVKFILIMYYNKLFIEIISAL